MISFRYRWYLGGALVTGGGLIFAGNTDDFFFRAYDIDDGRVLWRSLSALPARACGTPISYRSNGRQYIAVISGGCEMTNAVEFNRADNFVVFSVPENGK